jgi:hypothetical protein
VNVKNAPKFAIALIAAACVSTSAFASETSKEQPLKKSRLIRKQRHEASGDPITGSAG